MTDAQIFSSFSKAHKLLCATPSVSSKSTASIILLSLIHSHLLSKHNDRTSQQDNRSIETISTLCGVPFDRVRSEFQDIPIDTLNAIRHTIYTWRLTLEVYENVFGSLFEKYITDKKSGAYYTSPATSEYITLRSLLTYLMKGIIPHDTLFRICTLDQPLEWFSETVKDLTGMQRSSIIDRLASVTIIDPTCGTGAFLVQAFKCLLQIYQILSFKVDKILIRSIIRKHLYGVDIDPEAITILKFRFLVIAQSFGIDDIKSMPNFKIGDTLKSDTFALSEGFPDGGTFDIVIGNPPYVETTRRQRDTYDTGLTTLECGNLYAFVTEKAIRAILKEGGILGFIVPISIASTARMTPLRELICDNSGECFFSHYADRPGCLFIGVHQKLTICLLIKSSKGPRSIYTSRYNHWSKGATPLLFSSVKPYRIDIERPNLIIPKIGSDIEKDILSRVCADRTKNILDATADNGRYSVWLNMRMCFWAKAFCHEQNSREYKRFDFDNQQLAKAFAAFFNSSLFFFIWEAMSDCWHITSREFSSLNFSLKDIPQPILDSLCTVYDRFEAELERTKKHIGSVQTEYIYQHKFHKHHIDKIDDLLGEFFGFSEAGLEYIKRYQETYRLNTVSRKKMNVIDLFSGVGGLSLGFENVGFNIVLANEIDPEIAGSYRLNHPDTVMLNCDIKEFADDTDECIRRHSRTTVGSTFSAVIKQLNSVDVVIGGPPCQGFSMAGGRIRKAKAFFEDPRNNLFHQYFRIIQKYEPRYFVFENVVGLLSSKKGEIIKTIKSLFSDSANFKNGGYHLNIKILDASDFGVPQTRRRVFIIGSKTEFDIDKAIRDTLASFDDELRARFTQKKTVRDAIYDLSSHVDDGGFPNHNATAHSAKAKMRMQKIRPNQNFTSLDEEIKSIHSGSYGRLDWDKPATTITTRFDTPSAGRYIHPDADRTITPREAARIQSFPDSFVFYGSKSSVCKQIGNAVPPRMAEFIARLITYIDTNQTKC